MRLGITYRLFLSMLAATCLAIVCLLLLVQWSLHRGFLRYLGALDRITVEQVAERLERLRAERGTLEFLKDDPREWVRVLMTPGAELVLARRGDFEERGPQDLRPGLPPPPGIEPPHRRLLVLDAARAQLLGPPTGAEEATLRPLLEQGRIVGYVGMVPPGRALDPLQLHFLSQQKFVLALAAAGVVLVAGLFSLLLARRLVRPIRGLAAATRTLASGQYAARVPATSSDELGQLARDFNALALTLEKNEELRRRWVADISHELRTPLAILRGEVEALLDGVRASSPESLGSLHAEVLRLTRLVDDLYQLSLSDLGALTYRKEDVDLAELLDDCLDRFRGEFTRKSLRLEADVPREGGPRVFGDPERLAQLFTNLLDNSLKYTDAGGQLVVSLETRDGVATVDFEDSAPGVGEGDLARLFDRLYRVDASRNRASGGAGLGLAIAKSIAEAHAGTLEAHSSRLGGVQLRVTLPTDGGG
ncbi:MAG: HAMP domain-containing protein [Deltaproteobacteria bacterium]|nr:HAMP domain-containing protein [Deltaproteobacteria bacterium]